jgi:hypothetical protein
LIQFLCHPERRKKPTEEREIAILAVLAEGGDGANANNNKKHCIIFLYYLARKLRYDKLRK